MPDTAPTIDMQQVGGIITVILAKDMELMPPYDTHPQVVPLQAAELPLIRDELNAKLPTATKLCLIGGKIPDGTYTVLRRVLEARHITYVNRNNTMALSAALRQSLEKRHETKSAPPLKEPLKTALQAAAEQLDTHLGQKNGTNVLTMKSRGSVATLLTEADLSKGSAEEARRLFREAQKRGIATTVGSLQTGISNLKRKGGRTETPKSIMTAQERALMAFDEAIEAGQKMLTGLAFVREYVANTEQESVKLANRLREFQALAAMVVEDTKMNS